MFTHVPFAYQVGPLQITGFGVAMLLAFVVGQIVSATELENRGEDSELMGDVIMAAVVGGLLGAKIYYAILVGDPSAIFSRAGFVFWGGLMGGIVAVAAMVAYKKAKFTHISDAMAPALAAAYAIGRTGCWAVGDDYGKPWDGPLSVAFPEGAPPSTVANLTQQFGAVVDPSLSPDTVLAVHPTQLYETALGMLMFALIWKFRGHTHQRGWLFGGYLALAGVERFIIEFFRAKDDRFFGPLTVAQVIAIAFMLGGMAWMFLRRRPPYGAATA
jgi:phosphatidylglycerol:prolipoprotein diacylglycerol transferase